MEKDKTFQSTHEVLREFMPNYAGKTARPKKKSNAGYTTAKSVISGLKHEADNEGSEIARETLKGIRQQLQEEPKKKPSLGKKMGGLFGNLITKN